MEYRRIGAAGPMSSALGLGCIGFTGCYGPANPSDSIATVRFALDLGVNLLVMADFYAGGFVEELVGRAVSRHRDSALISTSGGAKFTTSGKRITLDGSPKYLRRACEESLQRLGTDYIDVYYLDGVDPLVPVEESIQALAGLATAGKICYIGITGASIDILRRAHKVHPIAAFQGEYSLCEKHAEKNIQPITRELGISFMACSSLGRGFLTGRVTSLAQLEPGDDRRRDPRLWPGISPANLKALRAAEKLAATEDISVGRLALSWLLRQGEDTIPLVGTRRKTHLEMNAAAIGMQLSAETLHRLAAVFPESR